MVATITSSTSGTGSATWATISAYSSNSTATSTFTNNTMFYPNAPARPHIPTRRITHARMPSIKAGLLAAASDKVMIQTHDAASLDPQFNQDLFAKIDFLEPPKNWDGIIVLPDGTYLHLEHGNFFLDDADAQVTYRANRVREFNRFLNASDLLEEFIEEAGQHGVKQHHVLEGLFGVFLHWLILKAAEKDGDPIPDYIRPIAEHPALPKPRKPAHCRACGRFVSNKAAAQGLPFCNEQHVLIFMRKGISL